MGSVPVGRSRWKSRESRSIVPEARDRAWAWALPELNAWLIRIGCADCRDMFWSSWSGCGHVGYDIFQLERNGQVWSQLGLSGCRRFFCILVRT